MDSVTLKRMSQLQLPSNFSLPNTHLSSGQTGVVGISLADQLTHHHQRGKGDSAYSSFSGGSTAPDQPPSSLLLDHLQYLKSVCGSAHFLEPGCSSTCIQHSDPASICESAHILEPDPAVICGPTHILEADPAYSCSPTHFQHSESTSVCGPAFILQPDSPANVSQQRHTSPTFSNKDTLQTNRIGSHQEAPPPLHPPPIPARLDSFIAIKNLDNLRSRQDAEPQQALKPHPPHGHDQDALNESHSSSSSCQGPHWLLAGCNGGGDQNIQIKRGLPSARDWHSSEACPASLTPLDPLRSSPSVQHKGHFYFVTGVCQPAEGAVKTQLEARRSGGVTKLGEKEGDLCLPTTLHNPNKVFHSPGKDASTLWSHPQPSFDFQSRHTQSNPIFYCGPALEGDNASERISKEATPLLYQLTASRAALQQCPLRGGGGGTVAGGKVVATGGRGSSVCPLDDSSHRSYKDKLKVAQSKVLSRTSYQRRDLQLTRPPSLTTSESDSSMKRVELEAPKFKVAQPCLAPEQQQKKMCYSEPEKLHQLGSTPSHAPSHSIGGSSVVTEQQQLFESKGRVLSASTAIRSHLKQLQHQALLDYLVRKTGQKVVEEPQQAQHPPLALTVHPAQAPPPALSRQRHSLGEKPFDWVSVQQEESSSSNSRNKKQLLQLQRPHSAGRILDASSSSIRYAQFFSAQSSHGRWGRGQGGGAPCQGKSASVESLLKLPELQQTQQQRKQQQAPPVQRNRSTSTPQTLKDLQACDGNKKLLAQQQGSSNGSSVQKKKTLCTPVPQLAEGQVPVHRVSRRGQSMEELGGTLQLSSRPPALSRSSEQLEKMWRKCRRNPENPVEPWIHSHGPKGRRSDQLREPSSPTSTSWTGTVALTQSGPPSPAADTPSSNPMSPIAGVEISSHFSSPSQAMSSRDCTLVSSFALHSGAPEEVPLSCGVTTDPTLWLLAPAEEEHKEQTEVEKEKQEEKLEEVLAPPKDSLSDQQKRERLTPPSTSSSEMEEEEEEEKEVEKEQSTAEETRENSKENQWTMKEEEKWKPSKHWTELVKAVVGTDQSLARVFYPLANRKTARMLMEQLLCEDTLLMEEHYRRREEEQEEEEEELVGSATPSSKEAEPAVAPAVASSSHPDLQGHTHIDQQRHHLVALIKCRLRRLEEKWAPLQAEQEENAARGRSLEAVVQERCPPVELERYLLFVGDLEKVVSLLLCLSARLARVENALMTVDQHTDAEEKRSLDSRHRLLCKQQQDASELKENLERREKMVSTFLQQQLSHQQLLLYQRFLKTTAYLLIRNKELEEQQRLAHEQLEALGVRP